MTEIKKIAVIGSGVMGSGIAAQVANSGTPVVLLDIVPQGAKDRSELAKKAIEKDLKGKPPAFVHPNRAELVTPGNLEDNLDLLKDCDWIIEVVLEKLEVKQGLYKKIETVRKDGSVVSSNTSTLPLATLAEGMPERFQKDFMITHFFNPPRFMRLLEVVRGPKTRADAAKAVEAFADVKLGKGVVLCKDTPGFLANRIGVYWLMTGLLKAIELGITVEQADAVMGKPVGIPKTGVFGLFDLIGIDLMPLIAKAMLDTLPNTDRFRALYEEPELVKKMIADGYTGRKGKGGFYRLNTEGEKKVKEAIDLATGDYRKENKAPLESVDAAKGGLRALLEHKDVGGRYAWAVLSELLLYTASLIPEISDDILSVDAAMKLGYNWKYGPFELIDRLGDKDQSGAAWFAAKLKSEGRAVPPLIEKIGNGNFYKTENAARQTFTPAGTYQPLPVSKDAWSLADVKLRGKPVLKNAGASLWDIGDGIACLEYHTKMNAIDPDVLEMIELATAKVKAEFKGMIIGNDADHFSAGANLGFILYAVNIAAWDTIEGVIKRGQDAMMGMKYAPFPVVSALSGMALGGGCETVLHSDAVQAHIESYTGLVEMGVGLIPGWGGCKEMLLRHLEGGKKGGLLSALTGGGAMPAITKAFEYIATAKVSGSAEEARDMKILNAKSRITMNRARLLADAKALCLELVPGYAPPVSPSIQLPGASARVALKMAVKGFALAGKVMPHDEVIADKIAKVLTGGEHDSDDDITEQMLLDLERKYFMELIKTEPTMARIEHMLNTGKPLRN
ncbi:MAG: 3-hydroxyacyl-CoA dehydrogenase [Alphaproteobacteria bacterium]|nr:3-hydroxyacyl-CoA dehydrogenase [Alphaproteobacteria bacterium]